jgi:rhodanese-related sulfurtransferase
MRVLTLNQRLALVGLALGAVAVFADVHRGRTLTVHERDFATRIQRTEDHVAASELAAWIITGQQDYRLWDLRDAAAYAEYHIPTAENVPLASLADQELAPTDKVILYSDGGIHASQAMMLLWAQGKNNVYTLLGGLDAWKDEVLFPVAPASTAAADQAAFERSVQMSRFFGGQPRAATAQGASQGAVGASMPMAVPALPKVAPPTPTTGGGAAPPRKKKEGC